MDKKHFVVVTNKGKVISETLSTSRRYALRRYREKWLGQFSNPQTEWARRRRKGYRVATVQLREVV